MNEWQAIRVILPRLRRPWWVLPAIVGLGVLASLAEGVGIALFLPLLGPTVGDTGDGLPARLMEQAFGGLEHDTRLLVVSAAILAAAVIRSGLVLAGDAMSAWLYGRTTHELRLEVHDRLLQADFGWLQRTDQGRLLNGLANETWYTADAMQLALRMLTNAITVAVYGVLLLLLSWQLSVVVLGSLVLMAVVVRLLTRPLGRLSAELTAHNAGLATRMIETCSGGKVIRTFGREADVKARFDASSATVAGLSRRMELMKATVNPVYEVLAAAVIVVMLFVTLRGDAAGVATALVFLALLYRLQPRVKELDTNRVGLLRLVGGVQEVTRLLEESEPAPPDGDEDASELRPTFRLDDVTFAYDQGSQPALREVTAEIPEGRTTALVGPSGAGKTTFVDILLGLHHPTEGTVTMDGRSLRRLRLSTLRDRVGVVGQDTFLFNATVRDNIAFAQPDAPQEAVERAARLAHAAAFIDELPDGYDTLLGDDGVRVSGGQRQRLALARAVLREPDILVLDEATNALDSITEQLVQDALDELGTGRTVVVIAHRLSTVRRADHVLVLDGGRLAEQGTPAELLGRDESLFARMNRLQNDVERIES